MRIYFSQYIEHVDGSKSTLHRMAFGLGFRRSFHDFTYEVLPHFCNLILRAITQGYVTTLVDCDGSIYVKPSRSIRFVITLKFLIMVTQKMISVKLDVDQLEKLDRLCDLTGTNRNKMINFAVSQLNSLLSQYNNCLLTAAYQVALSELK